MKETETEDEGMTKRRSEAILASERRRYRIGTRIVNGQEKIEYYEPSPYPSQTEKSLIYGDEMWVAKTAYNLASQSFFSEKRTWIVFDFLHDYIGNDEPNDKCDWIKPRGIPKERMDVIAPNYYLRMLSKDEIIRSNVTDDYKIPLRFCPPSVMFEISKMNSKASYAATLEIKFNELMVENGGKVTVEDLVTTIEDLTSDPDFPPQLKWVFNMMIMKLKEIKGLILDDDEQWSSIGKALFKANEDHVPRWIVFTFGHARSMVDAFISSMIATVLEELRAFMVYSRVRGVGTKIGLLFNNFGSYIKDQSSCASRAIENLWYWGRTIHLPILMTTSNTLQLPKRYSSETDAKSHGLFQKIIKCDPNGNANLLDSSQSSVKNDVTSFPRFTEGIILAEPMIKLFDERGSTMVDQSTALVEKMGKI